MKTYLAFSLAALAEIAGCFAFWAWLRLDKSWLWVIPGATALACFAYLLTWAETDAAGRTYASYGGIYIVAAIACCGYSRGSVRIAGTSLVQPSGSLAAPSFCLGPVAISP